MTVVSHHARLWVFHLFTKRMSVTVLGMRMHLCTEMCTISKRDAVECCEGAREERVQGKDKRFLRKPNPGAFRQFRKGSFI